MYFIWYIIIGIVAGLTTTGLLGSLFTSVIGAVLLLWIISFFRHPKRTDI